MNLLYKQEILKENNNNFNKKFKVKRMNLKKKNKMLLINRLLKKKL